MLKIVADPRFTHPVTVLVPVDGGHREETFTASFRVIPFDQAQELARTDLEAFFDQVLIDCGDLADDDGKPLAWTEELRAQVLGLRFVQLGLVGAYFAAVGKARTGN